MARIRTIKPEFFTSEKITDLPRDVRLFFIGLWTFCDDSGVHPYSAKQLRMQVFPGEDDISAPVVQIYLDQLIKAKLIRSFDVEGKSYLIVCGWHEHQRVDRPTFKYPLPGGKVPRTIAESKEMIQRWLDEPSPPERKGREEERKGSIEEKETDVSSSSRSVTVASTPVKVEIIVPAKAVKAKRENEPEGFAEFYDRYPKTNCSRKESLRAYQKAIAKGISHDELIYAVSEYNRFLESTGTIAAHATTWLNNERWSIDYNAAIAARRFADRHRAPSAHEVAGNAWAAVAAGDGEHDANRLERLPDAESVSDLGGESYSHYEEA